MLSTSVLNASKPCTACRRRKVKCDKSDPCVNCLKHGIPCVYEAQSESNVATAASQQMLQERVDRLEKLIEDMSALSMKKGPEPREPATSLALHTVDPSTHTDTMHDNNAQLREPGIQVFEENVSYYLGPNYWLNLQDIVYEPRCLFRVDYDEPPAENTSSWPLGTPLAPLAPQDLSGLHLSVEHEDILITLLFKHVEPFTRLLHETYWRQQVTDFRIGVVKIERDIEALMFASQAMTVAALPARFIQETFHRKKSELLSQLQEATELAFDRANLLRSRRPVLFTALLYCINTKFITGESESATVLLGVAGRLGMRIGLHRDPSHYSYSPWISQMRRRLWNHFMYMDNQCYNLEGADSVLSLVSDVRRPINANDNQWTPTRFADPKLTPQDQVGFTDMTFVLMRNHLFITQQLLMRRRNQVSPEELGCIVDETEHFLKAKFINHLDIKSPIQKMTASYYNASMKTLRCFVDRARLRKMTTNDTQLRAKLFRDSVEILEEMERGEALAIENDWGWVYRWPVIPHTIATVLLGLAQQPQHPDINRAWSQVNMAFRRHNNEEISMRRFSAWRAIEDLCDQAMLYHRRVHEGAWYARRLDPPDYRKTQTIGTSSGSLEQPSSDILGDISMFGNECADSMLAMPPFFGSAPNLDGMGYLNWTEPNRGHPQRNL